LRRRLEPDEDDTNACSSTKAPPDTPAVVLDGQQRRRCILAVWGTSVFPTGVARCGRSAQLWNVDRALELANRDFTVTAERIRFTINWHELFTLEELYSLRHTDLEAAENTELDRSGRQIDTQNACNRFASFENRRDILR
jgi:hypothetical protein